MRRIETEEKKFHELKELLSSNVVELKVYADENKKEHIKVFKFDAMVDSDRAQLKKHDKDKHTITTYLGMEKWSACDYLYMDYFADQGFTLVMIEETNLSQSFRKIGSNKLLKKRISKGDIKNIITKEVAKMDNKLIDDTVERIFTQSNYITRVKESLDEILKPDLIVSKGKKNKKKIINTIAEKIDMRLKVNSLIEENRLKMESSLLLLYILRDQEDFKDLFPRPAQHYFVIYHSPNKKENRIYGIPAGKRLFDMIFRDNITQEGFKDMISGNISAGMKETLTTKKSKYNKPSGGINLFFGGVLKEYADLEKYLSNPNEM